MTTTDLQLGIIVEDYHREFPGYCYKLHKGILRWEIGRGYDRKAVIIELCPQIGRAHV